MFGSLQQRKQHRHNFFRGDLSVPVFLDHKKLLSAGQANRDHHSSASLELVDQGSWDQIGRRRDDHLVERRLLGPAEIAVCRADFDVSVALSFQPLRCSLRQLVDDFDAMDPAGKLGEHGGLVAQAGADFEDGVIGLKLK